MSSQDSKSVVYFIACNFGYVSAVKIGTTRKLKQRMIDLQVGCPYKLELLATRPGGRKLERFLHKFLSEDRLEGEWFSATSKVMAIALWAANEKAFAEMISNALQEKLKTAIEKAKQLQLPFMPVRPRYYS